MTAEQAQSSWARSGLEEAQGAAQEPPLCSQNGKGLQVLGVMWQGEGRLPGKQH